MTTDIVEQLRERKSDTAVNGGDNFPVYLDEARDLFAAIYALRAERDALAAEIARLREALAPFALEADAWADYSEDETICEPFPRVVSCITVGDCRRARAALAGGER